MARKPIRFYYVGARHSTLAHRSLHQVEGGRHLLRQDVADGLVILARTAESAERANRVPAVRRMSYAPIQIGQAMWDSVVQRACDYCGWVMTHPRLSTGTSPCPHCGMQPFRPEFRAQLALDLDPYRDSRERAEEALKDWPL